MGEIMDGVILHKKEKLLIFALVGFALLGDAMLYVVLPTKAEILALTAGQIGILLSINRIIRLGSNSWAAYIYEKLGRDLPFYFAVLLGSATTVGYGISQTFWFLLLLRLLWGISYSLMRLRALLDIFSPETKDIYHGRLSGLFRAISMSGYILGMIAGGFLSDFFGFSLTSYLLGFVSMSGAIALIIFYILKYKQDDMKVKKGIDKKVKKSSNYIEMLKNRSFVILLLVGLVVHFISSGLINSSYGMFLKDIFGLEINLGIVGITIGVATLNGIILSSRSFIELFFSPFLGWLIDKHKKKNLIFAALLLKALFLCFLAFSSNLILVIIFPILIFFLYSFLVLALYIKTNNFNHQTTASSMAGITTAGDLGAALGPLTLLIVNKGISLSFVYIFSAFLLLIVAYLQRKEENKFRI